MVKLQLLPQHPVALQDSRIQSSSVLHCTHFSFSFNDVVSNISDNIITWQDTVQSGEASFVGLRQTVKVSGFLSCWPFRHLAATWRWCWHNSAMLQWKTLPLPLFFPMLLYTVHSCRQCRSRRHFFQHFLIFVVEILMVLLQLFLRGFAMYEIVCFFGRCFISLATCYLPLTTISGNFMFPSLAGYCLVDASVCPSIGRLVSWMVVVNFFHVFVPAFLLLRMTVYRWPPKVNFKF